MQERVVYLLKRFIVRTHLPIVSLFLVLLFAYLWHLGSWTAGESPVEASTVAQTTSWSSIVDNPLNLPHKLLQLGSSTIWDSPFGHRLPAAILAIVFLLSFYVVLRSWFGRFTGAIGALIFATTPWLIISGRQATAAILLTIPTIILANYLWLMKRSAKRPYAYMTICILVGLALYVPGMLWLLLAAVWLARRQLKSVLLDLPKVIAWLGICLFLLLAAPLVWALVKHPTLIKPLLLIPAHFSGAIDTLKSLVGAFGGLFWRTPDPLDITIARWSLLNDVQIILSIFGSFYLWRKARRIIYGVASLVVLAVLAAGFNNDMTFLLISLPAFGVLLTAGVHYLYAEWQTVFPRNPIPRSLALAVLGLLATAQVFFGVHYALVAWPHTVATQALYVLK